MQAQPVFEIKCKINSDMDNQMNALFGFPILHDCWLDGFHFKLNFP